MHDAFVGRQPIFDKNMGVYAYELLFRNGNQQNNAGVTDGNQASSQVMLNTFTEFGLDSIVGNHFAFINLTYDLLLDEVIQMLPRERVVLEILENVKVTDELVNAVRQLSNQGYIIALDDFTYDDNWLPLIELADIIKLDVLSLNNREIEEQVKLLRPFNTRLLAEKVETMEHFTYLKSLDFDYYQGYFLSKPNIVAGKRTPTSKLSVLQLLAKLMQTNPEQAEIDRLISQDVTLSYKILRFINASCFALPRKIESINEAILYLGLNKIRLFASMIAMAGFNDQPHEILMIALIRARMCELLANAAGFRDQQTYFTLGLFSTLDVMLGISMFQVLSELPLGEELEQALLYNKGDMGMALACTRAYEQQQWSEVKFSGLAIDEIGTLYLNSVQWSNEAGVSMRS